MNILVGVISPVAAWSIPRAWVEELRRNFPRHTFLEAWDRETLRRLLPDADVAFTPFVDRDLFGSLHLRWVQSPAVGVGTLLYSEMIASAVVITNARGIRARAMAEHVLGVTIALARQLPAVLRYQVAHHWGQNVLEGSGRIRTLNGLRMGIVGLGSIGLDVFTHEPLDSASPYWDLPNVIVTPHISGALEDYWVPLVALFSENLRRFEAGQPLLNVVDKEAGY